jgi:hypothetical protein
MSGTPEGFNWAYKYFIKTAREDTEIIYGNSRKNTHLHGAYIETLEGSYDELMRKQFIDGDFVNLNGRPAAWAFDRKKHVMKRERNPNADVWLSIDFNVAPMTGVLYEVAHGHVHAIKEFSIKSKGTTKALGEMVIEFLGRPCPAYPDPAGAASSTRSEKSDIQILDDLGFDTRYKRKIISVKDCLNALNAKIDRGEFTIDPECEDLIGDFEQVKLKEDGTLDKRDPELTHLLDGAKNMIDYEFPIVKHESSRVSVNRYA